MNPHAIVGIVAIILSAVFHIHLKIASGVLTISLSIPWVIGSCMVSFVVIAVAWMIRRAIRHGEFFLMARSTT